MPGGIKKDERQIGIVEKERVDETVVVLSGEILQDGFAFGAVAPLFGELI